MLDTRSNNHQNLRFRGNKDLLSYFKTAFFCSRQCPDAVVPRSRDWARQQSTKERCVISGFHSPMERKLLHVLLEEEVPVIMVLARSLYKRLPDQELTRGIDEGNLLTASPFGDHVNRASAQTARKRNELMIELADEIMVAHATPGGSISKLLRSMKKSRKLLYTIDIPGNKHLTKRGFYAV